jgi:hypothetical protein
LPKQKKFCGPVVQHHHGPFHLQEEEKMRTLSVVMIAMTFVLGVGIISLLFVLGKMLVDMVQNVYRKKCEVVFVLAKS